MDDPRNKGPIAPTLVEACSRRPDASAGAESSRRRFLASSAGLIGGGAAAQALSQSVLPMSAHAQSIGGADPELDRLIAQINITNQTLKYYAANTTQPRAFYSNGTQLFAGGGIFCDDFFHAQRIHGPKSTDQWILYPVVGKSLICDNKS